MPQDFYQTLGVARGATADELQKSYRKLARKFHPDANPDDKTAKEKFKQVQEAYDVLSDPEKRKLYDQFGHDYERVAAGGGGGGGRGGARSWSGGGPGGANVHFEDVDLGDLFGAGGGGQGGFSDLFRHFGGGQAGGGDPRRARRPMPTAGADVHADIRIEFEKSILGGEVEMSVIRGGGKRETIVAKIPQGIEDGKSIRLRGQGEKGQAGGPAGDLLIAVHVQPHEHFRRDGKNLIVTVPVTLAEAAGGAKVDVPLPKGSVTVTVPPKTSSGKKLRLKGLGVDNGKADAGDLLAEIQLVLPPDLSDADVASLREIDQRHEYNPRAHLRW